MQKKRLKIQISPFFYVVLILIYILDVYNLFIFAFIFTLLHELAHILTAKFYGLRTQKLCITPIGLVATIDGLDNIALYKRLIIVSAGAMFNILVYIIITFIPYTNDSVQLIKNINLSIALFNVIPIFPLDGGKFFIYFVGSLIGDLRSCKIVKKMGLYFCIAIGILGIFQVFLYPFNISLLALCIYILKVNKGLYIMEFYKILMVHKDINKLKIKYIYVDSDTQNKDIILSFSSSYYTIINFYDKDNKKYRIYENEFIKYVKKYGIIGNIYNIVSKIE